MRSHLSPGTHAFTICDLTAVLAVLTLGTILALGGSSRSHFKRGDCTGNLRQLGMASQIYAVDNSDHLPGCQHSPPSWIAGLAPYCPSAAYVCPSARATDVRFSFALNDFLTPHPYGAKRLDCSTFSSIPAQASTLLFAEAQPCYLALNFDHFHFADGHENGFTAARFRQQVDVERHGLGANYLFSDGHLEPLSWTAVEVRLSTPKSLFVHPQGASGVEYSEKSPPFIVAR